MPRFISIAGCSARIESPDGSFCPGDVFECTECPTPHEVDGIVVDRHGAGVSAMDSSLPFSPASSAEGSPPRCLDVISSIRPICLTAPPFAAFPRRMMTMESGGRATEGHTLERSTPLAHLGNVWVSQCRAKPADLEGEGDRVSRGMPACESLQNRGGLKSRRSSAKVVHWSLHPGSSTSRSRGVSQRQREYMLFCKNVAALRVALTGDPKVPFGFAEAHGTSGPILDLGRTPWREKRKTLAAAWNCLSLNFGAQLQRRLERLKGGVTVV